MKKTTTKIREISVLSCHRSQLVVIPYELRTRHNHSTKVSISTSSIADFSTRINFSKFSTRTLRLFYLFTYYICDNALQISKYTLHFSTEESTARVAFDRRLESLSWSYELLHLFRR